MRNSNQMGKRGQLTIFLIVGIILLFSSAIVMYIKGEVVDDTASELPQVERIPLELQPLKTFVENCISDVATEAIQRIGRYGGYIDSSDTKYTGNILRAGYEPTESDVLVFLDDKKIPYWWFLDSDNDCLSQCQFASKRPPLTKTGGPTAIVNQIKSYIKENILDCVDEFSSFEELGFDVEIKSPPEPDIRLTEEDVLIITEYPLTVSREGTTTDMLQFLSRVDVPLKNVYDFASDITDSEIDFKFLENHVMNMIVQYSKPTDAARLPPISHVTLDPGEFTVWTRTETQDKIESYVLPRVGILQVIGSRGFARNIILAEGGVDPIAQGLMDNTNIYLNSGRAYSNIQADFAYLDWWPIYLNINDQEVLMPETVMNEFLPIMPKNYRFFYDVSFPVLVTLQVPGALGGEGYRFVFALEGNIRNNLAIDNATVMFTLSDESGSMVCDPDKRHAGPVGIETVNIFTREPISRVMVNTVFAEEFCFMGFTELDNDNRSRIDGGFPTGIGEISLQKEGYAKINQPFGAFLDTPVNHTFEMMPIRFINVTVRTKNMLYDRQGKYIMADPANPAAEGPVNRGLRVFLMLERVDEDAYKGYESYVNFDGAGGPVEMELIPGHYEVQGYLIDDGGLYIPPKIVKIDSGPFAGDKEIPFNETDVESWMHGGISLKEGGGVLEISSEELFESKHIVFYVMRFPKPQLLVANVGNSGDAPDMTQISTHAEYSEKYLDALQPKFIANDGE